MPTRRPLRRRVGRALEVSCAYSNALCHASRVSPGTNSGLHARLMKSEKGGVDSEMLHTRTSPEASRNT